jgi:hypothetical protein
MELSVYGVSEGTAELDFQPSGTAATVFNRFQMKLEKDIVLDGFVQWSQGVSRPYGTLTYKCPEGDNTGAEIAACTVWQGVVYAADAAGKVGLLPAEGEDAPATLIFADLGASLLASETLAKLGFTESLSDILLLKGCQE